MESATAVMAPLRHRRTRSGRCGSVLGVPEEGQRPLPERNIRRWPRLCVFLTCSKEFSMADHPATPRNRGDHDAPHMSPATPAEDARSLMLNRIAWGAVLAGVVIALVTQLVLNMIGLGIGVSTLDPAAGANENPSATSLSIG